MSASRPSSSTEANASSHGWSREEDASIFAERSRAAAIHASLRLAERAWLAGDDIAAIEQVMRTHLAARGVAVDYAAIVDRESLEPLSSPVAKAIVIIAGRLGTTRLIDNHSLPPRG